LLCEDPDAPRGTFVHWVAANLPADSRELSEGVPQQASLPNGTVQGVNGFGKVGFRGPAPPPGKPHHYHFKLFALDSPLEVKSGLKAEDLKSAMHGHVLAESELVGLYQR
jgi:Raf kinase inhibitor-like YbhB/YbcL family protein